MVMLASFVGAVAVYARVALAVPTDYGAAAGYGDSSNYGKQSDNYSPSPSTYAAAPAYTSSSYGSGSSNWNNGGYDSCVQQCVAQFGSPASVYMPPSSTSDSGSSGSGATHTVWVAPTQGVLRYVPFAVNASVGDTVELCNKTSDHLFATGEQNKGFTFTQVVNDTNPTFYYCGTPTHCQKGMFGIINPPSAFQQPGSASNMMPALASKNPSTQAGWSYANNATTNSTVAANWGNNIDMSKMPDWAHSYAAENIAYTRAFLGMNPETVSKDGVVDFSPLNNNAVMVPADVAAALPRVDNAESSTSSSASPSSTSTSSSKSPSGTSASSKKNGAGALVSPRGAAALVAVAAAYLAL
ncbi:hypothetical protein B0F90DRAFT_1665701 [Multifurca ochricompacta]|uniref:Phytocyanin domain-containing protein n=1 Tax=Multifurca ochricompacta TaxID=376703 RepID=A0AAD4MA33_9AGAM|nr:hypothetical protein B0F90DRAFT_1665701 [Multifurca ochricompacta]